MRRVGTMLVVIAAVSIWGALPAEAAPVIETRQVGFTLSSSICPNLPSGTTIEGSGTEKSITTFLTRAGGVTTVMNTTHTHGTATDQDGNTYVFNYSNEFRATLDGDVFSGLMTDSFALAGPGPAHLNNGFVGHFVSDFSSFFTVPDVISSHGDPTHCDPL
jgi:hypothetical protein